MQAYFSDQLAKPVGPVSPAVRSDAQGHIFVSGQIGESADTGNLVDGGIGRETEQVFSNLTAVLEASDRSFSDVVRATVFLTNMADFAAVNSMYAKHSKAPYPARTAIAVAALPLGATVEIDVIVAA
jgi:2-iminobutanoate/2-iminopropanoate deaminase